jgi:fructose-specific phosphotransferase system IIA component
MKVHELLNQEVVIPELTGKNKDEIINELIDLFRNDPRVIDLEKVRQAVLDREKIMSTGVGKGFAIPHGKTNSVTEVLAAFGKTSYPFDYQALDNQPVNLVFLLVGKENLVSTHIKLLSRISRMMNKDDFRKGLINAATGDEIIKMFRKEEENYFDV